MPTQPQLLARLNQLVRAASEDVLPTEARLGFINRALREHSLLSPGSKIVDVVAPGSPITEYALPSDFTEDSQVISIEAPPDQPRLSLLEPEAQWRLSRTSTGAKIIFGSGMATAFRFTYTQQLSTTDLSSLNETEADAVTLLAAHYCMMSVGAAYAQIVRGVAGSPADLADAREGERMALEMGDKFREDYNLAVQGSDEMPRGPVIATSEAAVRRIGHPIRNQMPRGMFPFVRRI